MRVLLIDDDVELCQLLVEFLRRQGFTVDCEHDGNAGLARALSGDANLVVLDVMLPGIDGFEILRRLRQSSSVPVIMLTARGDDVDRIVGLDLGADDYVPKPFNARELVARINAVLRRYEARNAPAPSRIEVSGIVLNPATREATADGEPLDLTTFEFDILEQLMRSAGRVLSRDSLMEMFYNRKATPFDRSIDMHISHLRKKLKRGENLIKTIRGVGYQFAASDESGVPT